MSTQPSQPSLEQEAQDAKDIYAGIIATLQSIPPHMDQPHPKRMRALLELPLRSLITYDYSERAGGLEHLTDLLRHFIETTLSTTLDTLSPMRPSDVVSRLPTILTSIHVNLYNQESARILIENEVEYPDPTALTAQLMQKLMSSTSQSTDTVSAVRLIFNQLIEATIRHLKKHKSEAFDLDFDNHMGPTQQNPFFFLMGAARSLFTHAQAILCGGIHQLDLNSLAVVTHLTDKLFNDLLAANLLEMISAPGDTSCHMENLTVLLCNTLDKTGAVVDINSDPIKTEFYEDNSMEDLRQENGIPERRASLTKYNCFHSQLNDLVQKIKEDWRHAPSGSSREERIEFSWKENSENYNKLYRSIHYFSFKETCEDSLDELKISALCFIQQETKPLKLPRKKKKKTKKTFQQLVKESSTLPRRYEQYEPQVVATATGCSLHLEDEEKTTHLAIKLTRQDAENNNKLADRVASTLEAHLTNLEKVSASKSRLASITTESAKGAEEKCRLLLEHLSLCEQTPGAEHEIAPTMALITETKAQHQEQLDALNQDLAARTWPGITNIQPNLLREINTQALNPGTVVTYVPIDRNKQFYANYNGLIVRDTVVHAIYPAKAIAITPEDLKRKFSHKNPDLHEGDYNALFSIVSVFNKLGVDTFVKGPAGADLPKILLSERQHGDLDLMVFINSQQFEAVRSALKNIKNLDHMRMFPEDPRTWTCHTYEYSIGGISFELFIDVRAIPYTPAAYLEEPDHGISSAMLTKIDCAPGLANTLCMDVTYLNRPKAPHGEPDLDLSQVFMSLACYLTLGKNYHKIVSKVVNLSKTARKYGSFETMKKTLSQLLQNIQSEDLTPAYNELRDKLPPDLHRFFEAEFKEHCSDSMMTLSPASIFDTPQPDHRTTSPPPLLPTRIQ